MDERLKKRIMIVLIVFILYVVGTMPIWLDRGT